MAPRKKLSVSKSLKVNYENDYVSVCVYCWDPECEDIAILFQCKDQDLFLPSKKVKDGSSARYPGSSKSTSKSCSLPLKHHYAYNAQESSDKKFNGRGWKETTEDVMYSLFEENIATGPPQLLYLLRTYSPINDHYYSHAIFAIKIGVPDINKLHLEKNCIVLARLQVAEDTYKTERNKIMWILEGLYRHVCHAKMDSDVSANPWGTDDASNKKSSESLQPGAITEEVNPQIIFEESKSQQIISPVTLFNSPGYSYSDKMRLYEEFVHLSFPFSTVVFRSVKSLLTELGFGGKEERVFRALDQQNCEELDIYQFMLGLTAVDPLTEHGNGPAEYRCRLIFRYYDDDQDGLLGESDLQGMIRDIAECQGQKLSEEQIQNNVQNAFKVFGVPPSDKVSVPKFLVSVGNLRFRGTSQLFRASNSIPFVLKKRRDRWAHYQPPSYSANEEIKKRPRKTAPTSALVLPSGAAKGLRLCQQEPSQTEMVLESFSPEEGMQSSFGYMLAEHTVMVRRSGMITSVANLLDMERAGELCNTGLDTVHEADDKTSSTSGSADGPPLLKHKQKIEKQVSAQAFNVKSIPNEILAALRYFEYEGKDKAAMSWGAIDKMRLGKFIIGICESMKEILDGEPRLLHISTPCYVLGDLHGNFHDLICFEKALWRLGPHLTPATFLFLGDYVDRGDCGVEVVVYLFAQKLRAPNRFHLLRGNHEVRDVQKFFTFHSECLSKFGPQMGAMVWEEINQVFDRMPLAAVVDNKIFCIHGGVPNLKGPLKEINEIPTPLPNPEVTSPLAWQLMWNDPVASDELTDAIKEQLEANQGFADNVKRQTAYVFNAKAFEKFLENNNLTHVIRAHEVKLAGFEIQQQGRLFTVFSSSQYCGTNNEAACILVHDMRIRVIRIDTNYS